MAVDTAAKRLSAVNIGCVWRGPATFPSGTVGADERLSLAWLYGGLAAEPPVTVPDVVGQDQASATAEIEAEGLVVAVAQAYSDSVAAGNVISQDPIAGSEVSPGSTVTITVSLGAQQASADNSGGWPTPAQIPRRKRVPEPEYERLRALEAAEEERERALARARSEKARQKERERLEKARAARVAQERLIALMAEEMAAAMRGQEAQLTQALALAEEEEAILLLLAM